MRKEQPDSGCRAMPGGCTQAKQTALQPNKVVNRHTDGHTALPTQAHRQTFLTQMGFKFSHEACLEQLEDAMS